MNDIYRKLGIVTKLFLVSCLALAVLITDAHALTTSKRIVLSSISIDDRVVTYTTESGDQVYYNVDTGLFILEGKGSAVITTEVVTVHNNLMSEEELLELDKIATLNAFESLKHSNEANTREYGGTGIPRDADYTEAVTFRKNIGDIVGELGEVLETIGEMTGILASCPAIPYHELLEVAGAATQLTGQVLQAAAAHITSDWTYQLHMTTQMYTVGNTRQYGYRYAQAGLIMTGTINGVRYDGISYISDIVGSWWVNQRPY